MRRIAHPFPGLRDSSQRFDGESGQTLVEYALIIGVVVLGSMLALGFVSGKVNNLFSGAGNSLNRTTVAVAPPPLAPPPSGTSVNVDPDGGGPLAPSSFTYLNPGPAHNADGSYGNCGGTQAACSGHSGFYNLSYGFSAAGLGSSFASTAGSWSGGYASSPPWTFGCTWHTSGRWGSYEAGCW